MIFNTALDLGSFHLTSGTVLGRCQQCKKNISRYVHAFMRGLECLHFLLWSFSEVSLFFIWLDKILVSLSLTENMIHLMFAYWNMDQHQWPGQLQRYCLWRAEYDIYRLVSFEQSPFHGVGPKCSSTLPEFTRDRMNCGEMHVVYLLVAYTSHVIRNL